MNRKKLIIIFATTLIILLAGSLWLYSLLNGRPQLADETFSNFPWGNNNTDEYILDDYLPTNEFPQINLDGPSLRQLTFRPVIGYSELNQSDIRIMRYVEAGTGHVYDINLETGQEDRVANITIPNAHEALVSQSGELVIVRSGHTSTSEIKVLTFQNKEIFESTLPYTIINMTLNADDSLIYTARSEQGLAINELSVIGGESRVIFSTPFISANIGWSIANIRPYYVYTKPASELLGYAYEINEQGNLIRLPFIGKGLTIIHTGDYIIYSHLVNNNYRSFIYNRTTGETTNAPIVMLPEKCGVSTASQSTIFCGHKLTNYDHRFPDNWYKGITTYDDSLWAVELNIGSAIQLVNPETITGRQLDLINVTNSLDGQMVYFLNRTDKTLWVYEIDN